MMVSHREIRMLHALEKISENLELIAEVLMRQFPADGPPTDSWDEEGLHFGQGRVEEVVIHGKEE